MATRQTTKAQRATRFEQVSTEIAKKVAKQELKRPKSPERKSKMKSAGRTGGSGQ
jgi:hypothetical protein